MSTTHDTSARRNPSAAVTAALTVGLFTSFFAPAEARATPPASLPDLVSGVPYAGNIRIGETATITVVVKNNGDGPTASNGIDIDLHMDLGRGLGLLELQPTAGQGWYCSSPVRGGSDGSTRMDCGSIKPLQPGQIKSISLRVHGESGQEARNFWLGLAVDPKHRIAESNEDNNVAILHF
ncbi:hypothetical protein Mkiyose1665_41470 [Mycobacterium kiyosense]|uniref:CARDB domain-containing protein n=2 Tax=Mycobacteriaceae TaxID=1762 RepID=A0A9P3UYT2_9MYCO|nr:hypothetical protein [Mycobacterium kiyosense]BDE16140.1 hypothetical protein MKCMC460_50000 [Mycobacterium sp. 20KCMC460]BDB44638.1 hypothetical protein IWGMT90018_50840 [Mycobacterium kiyosense]GLB82188.1 hypothetical protein SRL2020028_14440 [Mycobacterium kiyosense]GLB91635.1 hypothetical protein SRL2020130_44520 [Mycobacterium kiyosense]GLB95331.1 hypothetical protein SRL2020226_21070 [Mycobacterium kiyosense]